MQTFFRGLLINYKVKTDSCAKFGAFICFVTIISLSYLTMRLLIHSCSAQKDNKVGEAFAVHAWYQRATFMW